MGKNITSFEGEDVLNNMKTTNFFTDKRYIGTVFWGKNGYTVRLIIARKEVFHHVRTLRQAEELIKHD